MELYGCSSALQTLQSSDVSQGSLAYAVGVSMLDKEMEASEALNTQLIRSMEQSVTPHLGQSIDISI